MTDDRAREETRSANRVAVALAVAILGYSLTSDGSTSEAMATVDGADFKGLAFATRNFWHSYLVFP